MHTNIRQHLDLLGKRVKDKVTGLKGIVVSVGFDLYGCVQAIVNPGLKKDGSPSDSHWYDVARLEVLSDKPVMRPPNYDFGPQAEGKQGPAEKPSHYKP